MIFLYRFEVLEYDAALTVPVPGSSLDAAGTRRQVYAHTNYERTVFADSGALQAPMLPAAASGITAFTPLAVQHDGLRLDGEKASGQLQVTIPADHPVAQLYLFDAPGAQVWLTVAVKQDALAEPRVRFLGRISDGNFATEGSALMCELRCSPVSEVLARNGLTRKHPRSCGHTLFDAYGCGIARHQVEGAYWKYREDGLEASMSADGSTLTLPAAANRPDGWFTRGIVVIGGAYESADTWTRAFVAANGIGAPALAGALAPNGGVRRSVVAHTGSELKLDVALPEGLAASLASTPVTVYVGCVKTPEVCESDKFNNYSRFGGFKTIPLKNPYETGIRS